MHLVLYNVNTYNPSPQLVLYSSNFAFERFVGDIPVDHALPTFQLDSHALWNFRYALSTSGSAMKNQDILPALFGS